MRPRAHLPPEALSAWLDGELDPAEEAELAAELERDPALQADLAELERVVRFVRDNGPVAAPAGFEADVLARIAEVYPDKGTGEHRSWWRRPLGIPLEGWALGLAAAAALLVTIGKGPDETEPEGAARELSPAAVEPRKVDAVVPADPAAGEERVTETPKTETVADEPQVLGRASTSKGGPPQKVASDAWTPPDVGTANDVPLPSPTLDLPDTTAAVEVAPTSKPVPDGVAAKGTADADGHALAYRVRGAGPGVKLDLLKIAGRYGWAVIDGQGQLVTTARMAGAEDDLVLSLPQVDLARLDAELTALGHTVDRGGDSELVGGSTVQVRVHLSVDDRGAVPPAIDSAQRAQ